MSHHPPPHGHAPPTHAPAQAHQRTTVIDVAHNSVSDVFNAIWAADKYRIQAFHEKRFPTDINHGKYIVKVCDTYRGENVKAHNLFKLFKWDEVAHLYKSAHNSELLADAEYKSYKLVSDMFDNYESDETKPEVNTKEECQEIMNFLSYVVDSEPMKVASAYLRKKYSNTNNVDADDKESFNNRGKFLAKLKKVWFDQYDWGKMKSLSGFEHTFVGERRADGTVMGYHFWYKYFVDDSTENPTHQDAIDFNKRLDDGSSDDYVAIRFKQYVDTDHDGVVDGSGDSQLFKSFGSFFVGCSAECKMALGTIAYYESKAAWIQRRREKKQDDHGHDAEGTLAQINGHHYKLNLHRGGDRNQYCRSFYPEKA